jgi:hypothetical protein
LRTAKGATHGKDSFAVQESMAHGEVLGHDNTVRCCRGVFLFCALISLFAVLAGFAMCFSSPLPCDHLCRVLVLCFIVRVLFAVRRCVFAVRTVHDIVWLHGKVCFSGSVWIKSVVPN